MTNTPISESAPATDVAVRVSKKSAPAKPNAPVISKSDMVVKKLRSVKGVSLQQLADATGWQLHSVRGFLSGTVRKKLSLNLVSDVGKDEVRRYRIVDYAGSASS